MTWVPAPSCSSALRSSARSWLLDTSSTNDTAARRLAARRGERGGSAAAAAAAARHAFAFAVGAAYRGKNSICQSRLHPLCTGDRITPRVSGGRCDGEHGTARTAPPSLESVTGGRTDDVVVWTQRVDDDFVSVAFVSLDDHADNAHDGAARAQRRLLVYPRLPAFTTTLFTVDSVSNSYALID